MRTIDLHNRAASDVQYNIITFPDGELHIKLDDIDRKEEYNIVCRICNANDLFLLMQVGNILNNNQVDFTIDIMYLMSMRMDRIISFNEAYSLKLVADMINSLRARSVRVFHAHSNKTLKLLNNSVDYETYYNHVVYPHIIKYDVICFPDAGAYKRYVLENDRKSVNDDDTDIIVLINSANALQVDFLKGNPYDVDACLWIGDVGISGINAVADILVGDVNLDKYITIKDASVLNKYLAGIQTLNEYALVAADVAALVAELWAAA